MTGGTFLYHPALATGREFIEKVSKLGRERGVAVGTGEKRGKGSHITLYYGSHRTIVKDRRKEIGRGLLVQMLRDLGLTLEDLR